MIVHLRLSTPADMTDPVVGLLVEDPRVTDVTLVRGAGIEPPRDVVEADVAREAASDVLGTLTRMGLGTRGGISMTETTVAPCESARELERQAVGSPDDAVIWDVVLSHAESATRHTVSFHAFLGLATALAAIAVITDSPVLVVGAMVVGPEFGTIAAICCGIAFGRWLLAWRALALLVTGFAAAIAIVTLISFVSHEVGMFTREQVTAPRPLTGFIWHPDRWSFIVALLAGAAGALAATIGRAEAMVGVFISVTTVPAAGNLALALGARAPEEITGSVLQLIVNVTGMVLAGTAVILAQRLVWSRLGRMGRGTAGH